MLTGAVVAAAAALAALVKGTIGMGFPPVATPLIASVVGAQTAVASLAIPGFIQNVAQAWGGRTHLRWSASLLPFLVALTIGALAGAYLLTVLPVRIVMILMGAMVAMYAGLALLKIEPGVPMRWAAAVGGVAGLVAGVLGGATGIFAPVVALYLAALRLEKERFTATVALVLLVGQIPQIAVYAAVGLLDRERLLLSALMMPPVAIGFVAGTAIRSRISQRLFAAVVRWALLLIGLRLVFDALR